jgi:hypothetical protein
VFDLGLRLGDVAAMGLESEDVVFPPRLRKSPRERLGKPIAVSRENSPGTPLRLHWGSPRRMKAAQ